MPALVAGQSGIANAVKTVPAALHRIAKPRKALIVVAQFGDLMVKAVDVFPQFAGDAVADGARVFAGADDALPDRVRILFAEAEEIERGLGAGLRVGLIEAGAFAGHRNQRVPTQLIRVGRLLE